MRFRQITHKPFEHTLLKTSTMRAKTTFILALVVSITAEAPVHQYPPNGFDDGYNYNKPNTGVEIARQQNSNYQPLIAQYQAPIAQQQAPISQYQAPISQYQAPIAQYQASITQYQAPIAQYQAPIAQVPIALNQQSSLRLSNQLSTGYNYNPPARQAPLVQPIPQPQVNYNQPQQYRVQSVQNQQVQAHQTASGYQYPQPQQAPAQIYQQPQQVTYQQPIQQYTPAPIQQYHVPVQQYQQPKPQYQQPLVSYQQPQKLQQATSSHSEGYRYDAPQQNFNQGPTSDSFTGSLNKGDAELIEPLAQQRYVQPLGRYQNEASLNFQTSSGSGNSGLDASITNEVVKALQQDENNDLARNGLSSYQRVNGVSLDSPSQSIEVSSFVQNTPISNAALISEVPAGSSSSSSFSSNSLSRHYGLPEVVSNRQVQSPSLSPQPQQFHNFVPAANQLLSSYGVPKK